MLKAHPSFAQYLQKITANYFSSWSGIMFRSATIGHGNSADLISGEGSAIAGGRWNPPGLHAVYGSLEPGLSVDESLHAILRGFGFAPEDIHPRIIVGLEVRLQAVLRLDIGSGDLDWLNTDEMLVLDWRAENAAGRETASQALGGVAAEVGEALIVRSSVRSGLNVVIFPDSMRTGSGVRIIHKDELPA